MIMAINCTIFLYCFSLAFWIVVWWSAAGFSLIRANRALWIPFGLNLMFLTINLALVIFFGEIGGTEYEESRFIFIGERAGLAIHATASVLIVATIVYGLSIKRVPVHFIRFMIYAFITILGLMAPII